MMTTEKLDLFLAGLYGAIVNRYPFHTLWKSVLRTNNIVPTTVVFVDSIAGGIRTVRICELPSTASRIAFGS